MPIEESPFERTVCDCRECQVPCRTMPGALRPGDDARIAEYLNEEHGPAFFRRYFHASEGALVQREDGQKFRVPGLVPKLTPTGCVFMDANGHCKIHAVAPFGCSHFDTHMDDSKAQPRSVWALQQTIASHKAQDSYSKAVGMLAGEGRITAPLSQRRGAMEFMLALVKRKEKGK